MFPKSALEDFGGFRKVPSQNAWGLEGSGRFLARMGVGGFSGRFLARIPRGLEGSGRFLARIPWGLGLKYSIKIHTGAHSDCNRLKCIPYPFILGLG